MATYQHGVYNQEQATSLTTPIQSSAALQVILERPPFIWRTIRPRRQTPRNCVTASRSARLPWGILMTSRISRFARALM